MGHGHDGACAIINDVRYFRSLVERRRGMEPEVFDFGGPGRDGAVGGWGL